ncbi:MAG: 5'-nucleotidase C-terminal domain-containing protein [Sphingobacteriales bacterium]
MKRRLVTHLLILMVLVSCHTSYHPSSVAYKDYSIEGIAIQDPSYNNYLKPFRDSMELRMNETVGLAARRMDIKRPVTTLGNFLADAYLTMTREKLGLKADLAVMNMGGIRKPYVESGPITRGMVFEIMPFDNTITVVTVKGDLLVKYIESTMADGGGVSGFGFRMDGKMVRDIRIDGKPIDPTASYTLVTSDYASSDSRMAWFFNAGEKQQFSYLMRDCIIDYIIKMGKEGKPIGEQLENRIINDK